jgi:uncharacterized circularly permuted ATP-grasp superfamily protein
MGPQEWDRRVRRAREKMLEKQREVGIEGEDKCPPTDYFPRLKASGRRLDIIYERIESGRIYDDLPGLAEAQASGKVRAILAPILGIADDKGVYPFIPEMIRVYLGEEPVLQNVQTYSLAVEKDRDHVLEHFGDLVIKSRSGWGG